jgi:di/tricarboxylate transporter
MSEQLAVVLGLLAAAIAMFVINKPRMDAVALIMLAVLPFTGVLSIDEAIAGFSDSSVVLIAAMFVIGEGLVRTGVARGLGDWLTSKAGSSEIRLLVLLMLVVCGLGSVMSSTAVTAIFIPVALRCARTAGAPPSRLMMPLSFAALISGMMTLVASPPNLVINCELVRHGASGFRFFTFTPFGAPILVLGILYMILARHWLPADTSSTARNSRRPSLADWVEQYKLTDRECRLRVTENSPLVGQSLSELELRGSGADVLAIERIHNKSMVLMKAAGSTEVQAGDILIMDLLVPSREIETFRERFALETLPLTYAFFNDRSQEIGMAEVFVPADSKLIDTTIAEAKLRTRAGLTVIGLRRGRETWEHGFLNERLRIGDTLLVVAPWKQIERVEPDDAGVVVLTLPSEVDEVLPVPGKAPQAIFTLALVVAVMISGLIPNVHAALLGCLLMGGLGCIDLGSAYRAIDWRIIVLIVGMLPFSIALERTGGVDLMANGMMAVIGGAGPYGILACLFAITVLISLFISNTATAVLMAPVAIAVAKELHASPYPFAMTVALAASTAFITPVSSPVNTLVVTPGNYTFGDFVRIGAPFALIVLIVTVVLVPWLLPL